MGIPCFQFLLGCSTCGLQTRISQDRERFKPLGHEMLKSPHIWWPEYSPSFLDFSLACIWGAPLLGHRNQFSPVNTSILTTVLMVSSSTHTLDLQKGPQELPMSLEKSLLGAPRAGVGQFTPVRVTLLDLSICTDKEEESRSESRLAGPQQESPLCHQMKMAAVIPSSVLPPWQVELESAGQTADPGEESLDPRSVPFGVREGSAGYPHFCTLLSRPQRRLKESSTIHCRSKRGQSHQGAPRAFKDPWGSLPFLLGGA